MGKQAPALALTSVVLIAGVAHGAERVTLDNFVRAESDHYFKAQVDLGRFGLINHVREPTPVDKQPIVRMNRDTIYSQGVFDLTNPVTIVKPDTGGRFQSMVVLSEDHYIKLVAYKPGAYRITREKVGTRYAIINFRTLVDPNDQADIAAAHKAQDGIKLSQKDVGKFEVPDWDQDQLAKLRASLVALGPFVPDSRGMFGDKHEVDPVRRLLGAAGGWNGNREKDALYLNVNPAENDGKTPHVLTVKNVPVDGFWSISLYNAKGFYEQNPQNAYSVNNVTAKKDADGAITVHFGGDPAQPNFLAIMPGWNYTARLYQPKEAVLNGSWKFPEAKPVKSP